MLPVPPGLVDIKDPALYDPRTPPAASIFDVHVADLAAIQQSKLALTGSMPPSFLGTASGQAAPGNLSEIASNKGAPNGYAALDTTGKVFSSHFSPTANPGTVSSLAMSMPHELFTLAGSPVTTNGTFAVSFVAAPDGSWFGVNGISDFSGHPVPAFLTMQLPVALVPSLPASKFTTGVFPVEQLPVAAGMGTGHAPGILPDPGGTGDPRDYIGRDLQWHKFDGSLPYQPRAKSPNIVLAEWSDTQGFIRITTAQKNVSLFYRVSNPLLLGTVISPFIAAPGDIAFWANNGFFVEAYAARAGYNNSSIALLHSGNSNINIIWLST